MSYVHPSSPSPSVGQQLGIAGMQQVLSNNVRWSDTAIKLFDSLLHKTRGGHITGEGIRNVLLDHGLDHPNSPNAWGALTNALVRTGRIVHDGTSYEAMREPRSHGRRTPVYVVA